MSEQYPNGPNGSEPFNQESSIDLSRLSQPEEFLPFVEQVRTLNKLVQAITLFATPLSCGGSSEFRFKEVVVMRGQNNESRETGLTRLCGLTYILAARIEDLSDFDDKKDHSEFAFAYVPGSQVNFFIAHPHDLHDASRSDTKLRDPITTQSEHDIMQLAEEFTSYQLTANKDVFFQKASKKCASDQAIFDEIYKSACDPALNPHLFAASFAS